MVGRDSERAGIIKAGAKLVSAVSNSRVPKLTAAHSAGRIGAGNYAHVRQGVRSAADLCLAHGPLRGDGAAAQATSTLLDVTIASLKNRQGLRRRTRRSWRSFASGSAADYERQTNVRYAAARLWIDAILDPVETRSVLIQSLEVATRQAADEPYRLGVFQV